MSRGDGRHSDMTGRLVYKEGSALMVYKTLFCFPGNLRNNLFKHTVNIPLSASEKIFHGLGDANENIDLSSNSTVATCIWILIDQTEQKVLQSPNSQFFVKMAVRNIVLKLHSVNAIVTRTVGTAARSGPFKILPSTKV